MTEESESSPTASFSNLASFILEKAYERGKEIRIPSLGIKISRKRTGDLKESEDIEIEKEDGAFDWEGLLHAINEIEKGSEDPLPKNTKELGFCQVCIGSNVPEYKRYGGEHSEGTFCCGSWCDKLLPVLGLCQRFKVDRRKVKILTEKIRPKNFRIIPLI